MLTRTSIFQWMNSFVARRRRPVWSSSIDWRIFVKHDNGSSSQSSFSSHLFNIASFFHSEQRSVRERPVVGKSSEESPRIHLKIPRRSHFVRCEHDECRLRCQTGEKIHQERSRIWSASFDSNVSSLLFIVTTMKLLLCSVLSARIDCWTPQCEEGNDHSSPRSPFVDHHVSVASTFAVRLAGRWHWPWRDAREDWTNVSCSLWHPVCLERSHPSDGQHTRSRCSVQRSGERDARLDHPTPQSETKAKRSSRSTKDRSFKIWVTRRSSMIICRICWPLRCLPMKWNVW